MKKLAVWKQAWWDKVKRCIIESNKTPRQAAAHVRECKKRLLRPDIGDILYHENPSYIAERCIDYSK